MRISNETDPSEISAYLNSVDDSLDAAHKGGSSRNGGPSHISRKDIFRYLDEQEEARKKADEEVRLD